MTREEAIRILTVEQARSNQRNAINQIDYYMSDEAFDMAIEALNQEPCDDCISRQAVKEQMIKYGFHAPDMTVTEFVEDLQSVTPTHGKILVCPNCGLDVHSDFENCPRCGERMKNE